MMEINSSGSGENRDALQRNSIYVALVTKDFCTNDNCLGEMRDAFAMKVPMYAIMKSGTDIPDLVAKMPWKKIFIFTQDKQLPVIAELLKQECNRINRGK